MNQELLVIGVLLVAVCATFVSARECSMGAEGSLTKQTCPGDESCFKLTWTIQDNKLSQYGCYASKEEDGCKDLSEIGERTFPGLQANVLSQLTGAGVKGDFCFCNSDMCNNAVGLKLNLAQFSLMIAVASFVIFHIAGRQ